VFRIGLTRNASCMGTNLMQNHIRQESGTRRTREGRWADPHDPATNARPPGNGDFDRRLMDRSRAGLLAVVGR
jgi:hypothetical protein